MPLSERTQNRLDALFVRWIENEKHTALNDVEQYVGDLEDRHFHAAQRMDEIAEVMADIVEELQKLQGEAHERLVDLVDDLGPVLDAQREDLARDLACEREPYTRALGMLERHLFDRAI